MGKADLENQKKNAERRRRYQTDPLYRKSLIENSKRYRKKQQKIKKIEKERSKVKHNYWITLRVEGKLTECCKINFLSAALNRSNDTIRRWENEGNLPKTIKYNGIRYYTKQHYKMIVREWEYKDSLESFFRKVKEKWNKLY